MSKTIKLLSYLLLSMLVLFTGCGTKTAQTNDVNSPDKPVSLVMAFSNMSAQPPQDLPLVQAELDKLLTKKIGATVKLVPVDSAQWANQYNLMLAGGEQLDIVVSSNGNFSDRVAKGQLMPLDELVEKYGQEMKKVSDISLWKAGTIKGKLYAIPSVGEKIGNNPGIAMRKDLVDKYKIDYTKIKSLDDLDAVFKLIKTNEPETITFLPGSPKYTPLVDTFPWYDPLYDSIGVLPDGDNNMKVVNHYESPEYAKMLKKFRNWYLAGYIPKDVNTANNNTRDLIKNGKLFAVDMPINNYQKQEYFWQSVQRDVVNIPLMAGIADGVTVSRNMLGIISTSKYPQKAMEFINLLYTDKDVVNLIDWGIEGKHYVKTTGNMIDFPAGVTATTCTYNPNWYMNFANPTIAYLRAGTDPYIYVNQLKHNNTVKKSKALGFTWDLTPIKTEYAAVSSVLKQYKPGLENGELDPDKILPEFISKLKAAGIDKIIAEKQRQLDEWLKSK